jgi:hypothetical protein
MDGLAIVEHLVLIGKRAGRAHSVACALSGQATRSARLAQILRSAKVRAAQDDTSNFSTTRFVALR